MQYALECLEPKFFNWSEAILSLLKEQLTKVKSGKTKDFCYRSILISFSLEKIPLMQPHHVSLGVTSPRDPRMQRWFELMARHAGQSTIIFSPVFFSWIERQHVFYREASILKHGLSWRSKFDSTSWSTMGCYG